MNCIDEYRKNIAEGRCRNACEERSVSCRNRKRLKESEALSTRAMKNLSEKQRIIQEQSNFIKEKEKDSITDATSAKDEAILAAAENLEQKERAYADMDKRLDDTEALSTQAVNDLSEKDKIIEEQASLIEENEKEGISDALISKDKEILSAEENLKRKKRAYSDL